MVCTVTLGLTLKSEVRPLFLSSLCTLTRRCENLCQIEFFFFRRVAFLLGFQSGSRLLIMIVH